LSKQIKQFDVQSLSMKIITGMYGLSQFKCQYLHPYSNSSLQEDYPLAPTIHYCIVCTFKFGHCFFGAVRKRRPHSGGSVLSSADKEEGVFRCGRPHFLVQKHEFLKFIVCLHGQGGLSQCGHFANKVGGDQLHDFVQTIGHFL